MHVIVQFAGFTLKLDQGAINLSDDYGLDNDRLFNHMSIKCIQVRRQQCISTFNQAEV